MQYIFQYTFAISDSTFTRAFLLMFSYRDLKYGTHAFFPSHFLRLIRPSGRLSNDSMLNLVSPFLSPLPSLSFSLSLSFSACLKSQSFSRPKPQELRPLEESNKVD